MRGTFVRRNKLVKVRTASILSRYQTKTSDVMSMGRQLENFTVSLSIIVQQDATIYGLLYFCKLLYMFRVVTPPTIRSTYNCNYSIWHWSNHLCYLLLWWSCSNSFTITEDSRDGLTSARCCNYSYMCP